MLLDVNLELFLLLLLWLFRVLDIHLFFYIMLQTPRSTEAAYNCHGCSFWDGVFAFKEYRALWSEMWQFACELKRSFKTHMQGCLSFYSTLITWSTFLSYLVLKNHPNCICFNIHHDQVIVWLIWVGMFACNFQVGDFGLSKIKRNTLVSGGVRGTLPWMAPELLNGSSNRVSEKVRPSCLSVQVSLHKIEFIWNLKVDINCVKIPESLRYLLIHFDGLKNSCLRMDIFSFRNMNWE